MVSRMLMSRSVPQPATRKTPMGGTRWGGLVRGEEREGSGGAEERGWFDEGVEWVSWRVGWRIWTYRRL